MNPDKRTFWGRIFASHQSALNGFFRRRIKHPWDAEDLAQEVYARLLRVDDRGHSTIADPRAYLFTVASNLVKEHALLQKRHAAGIEISQMLPELEAPQGSAEDEAEAEYKRRRVEKMLAGLPPRCKAVLLMQHRDGMSYQDIASRLGVSTHMVKKYVVKALMLCRRDLMEDR